MKSIIIFNLLAITIMNPIVDAHENHDHQIYSWSNSNKNTIKTDPSVNVEKLEDKEDMFKTNNKNSWIKIFRR
tara:strand:+ start:216 stop:434 length:219 start_codon:yes stop_codon:yes gene_type:complete